MLDKKFIGGGFYYENCETYEAWLEDSSIGSVEIVYNDVDGSQHRRIIHPLYLFKYKENYYVTAFCELRNDIRHFEIKRIVNIK